MGAPAAVETASDPSPAGRQRPRWRRIAARIVFPLVVAAQVVLLVRGYHDPHHVLAFQMFNESSDWRADVVRVTTDGRAVPIDQAWPGGYQWAAMVPDRGLAYPQYEHHADAGVDNQLAFLQAALDWVADHTPADHETAWLEARVTYDRNTHGPTTVTLRSHARTRA
jgi:hypothetical protein